MNLKRNFILFFLFLLSQTSWCEQSSVPKTLSEAFNAALKRAESIEIQKELLLQAQETQRQAQGALYPSVIGVWNHLRQPDPSTATASAFFPSTQNLLKITATQPVFRGFREYATLRKSKLLTQAQTFSLANAAQQLFFDVSETYYNVLNLKQELSNYNQQLSLNHQRLKELEGFIKIGRAKLTDLLTFQANIASIEAQIEARKGQYEIAKDTLAFLTGWDREAKLEDLEVPLIKPSAIETYLSKLERRADIQLAQSQLKANEELSAIALGNHLPSADFLANYYFTRPGVLSNIQWDVQLAISFPLFQGGITQSQVRQAHSIARQYEWIFRQTQRKAEQEIRTLYHLLVADNRQLIKLGELVNSSKKNYETQLKYYRNGLVTNLDVLQSMTTYEDAQRMRDHQTFTIKLDTVKLQAATGDRPELIKASPKSSD